MATLLGIGALLIALFALFLTWNMRQDLDRATRRLDRYNRALFDANEEIRALQDRLAQEAADLKAAIARSDGTIRFDSQMTVREVAALHPQGREVLAAFHLGGCSSCAIDDDDTLAQISRTSGLDVEVLVDRLNALLPADQPVPSMEPVRLPNMQLEI